MEIDPATLDKAAAYGLMIRLIVPRPIAWVGSRSARGEDNLAPFSYFMGVASAPPMLALSVSRGRAGALKHTARNLLETWVFTVSVVEEAHLDPMHASGGAWEEPEFDVLGIPRAEGSVVAAPWVAGVRAAMECRVAHVLDLDQVHLFVGEVLRFHLAPEVAAGAELRPMARLGGDAYTTLGELLHRGRVNVPPRAT